MPRYSFVVAARAAPSDRFVAPRAGQPSVTVDIPDSPAPSSDAAAAHARGVLDVLCALQGRDPPEHWQLTLVAAGDGVRAAPLDTLQPWPGYAT